MYSLSTDPIKRDYFLSSIVKVARLFTATPGQLICIQNETCDNLFIVYSGSVDIHFNATGRVRGKQIIGKKKSGAGGKGNLNEVHSATARKTR